MQGDHYLSCRQNGTCFIKLVGSLRYHICRPFEAFLNHLFAEGGVDNFVIDLTEANFLDSTNLGLIARVANYLWAKQKRKCLLVAPEGDLREILDSVGFDEVFEIVPPGQPPPRPTGKYEEVPPIEGIGPNMGTTLLNAHQALIDANEKNRPVFQEVVSMLSGWMPTPGGATPPAGQQPPSSSPSPGLAVGTGTNM